jgi:HD-GYP domain-containing protein (c-di-GMP phosphodiesterase class II)
MDHTIAPLKDHHRRTAVAAYHISTQMDLSSQQCNDLIFSSAIHDIGAFSIEEQQALSDLKFEYQYLNRHARAAYLLFNQFPYFHQIAPILRYHHAYLNAVNEQQRGIVPLEAWILQVADHVAVLSDTGGNILDRAAAITAEIEKQSGLMFLPRVVDAYKRAAVKESFWLDIKTMSLRSLFEKHVRLDHLHVQDEEILGLANLFRRIIDFRSEFTSTHTAGVATVAAKLAELRGYNRPEVRKILIAGYLHDIGKLTVPTEILEKPGVLTPEEFSVIRTHTYYTKIFLDSFALFSEISDWASQHHERITGKGYPFHNDGKELSVESRVVAVADVFTALTEDRPYRLGLPVQDALRILEGTVQRQELDGSLVSLLGEHRDEINQARIQAQQASKREYDRFIAELKQEGF